MEWIATGVAIAAALFAGWQAYEARRARLDARASAASAQEYETRTVTAAERLAAAVEEQNAAERAERERYRNPWAIQRGGDRHAPTYKFSLNGSEIVSDVAIDIDEQLRPSFILSRDDLSSMRPGEAVTVTWVRNMGSPSQTTAILRWTRPNGEPHESAVTLD